MPHEPTILVVGASPILRELSEMLAASEHFGVVSRVRLTQSLRRAIAPAQHAHT